MTQNHTAVDAHWSLMPEIRHRFAELESKFVQETRDRLGDTTAGVNLTVMQEEMDAIHPDLFARYLAARRELAELEAMR
jgi:hypothetical protein